MLHSVKEGDWIDERMDFSSRFPSFPMSFLRLIGIGVSCREKGIIVRLSTSRGSCRMRACIVRSSSASFYGVFMAVENEAWSWVSTDVSCVSWSAAAARRHIGFLRASRWRHRDRKSARCREDAAASPIRFASPWTSTSRRSPLRSLRWSTVSMVLCWQHLQNNHIARISLFVSLSTIKYFLEKLKISTHKKTL